MSLDLWNNPLHDDSTNLAIAKGEIERLRAELADARRTAEYWKAEHLAGNAELDALKAQEPIAWIKHSFGAVSYGYYPNARDLPEEVKFDLYTHPVPSVPEELINAIRKNVRLFRYGETKLFTHVLIDGQCDDPMWKDVMIIPNISNETIDRVLASAKEES